MDFLTDSLTLFGSIINQMSTNTVLLYFLALLLWVALCATVVIIIQAAKPHRRY